MEELDGETTVEMLRGQRKRYEAHHRLTIDDDALKAAARLSSCSITDRFMPDKAIDLIDEASAKLRIDIYSMPKALREQEAELEPTPRRGRGGHAP